MCRWIAYRGQPVRLEDVIIKPCHSLVHQSLHASEGKTGTNGDGFGVGWYGDRDEPGVYREVRPAWSDENLRSICAQVRSNLFFAHVRAATGTATSRANCHPFAHNHWMFMHNGQIGGFAALRRKIENIIPDEHYASRTGSTDSEAIFLAALARIEQQSPIEAISSVLAEIKNLMIQQELRDALKFTAALTNGKDLYAFRWSCNDHAPTLYWRQDGEDLYVVSEPFDEIRTHWEALPQGSVLIAQAGKPVRVEPFIPTGILAVA